MSKILALLFAFAFIPTVLAAPVANNTNFTVTANYSSTDLQGYTFVPNLNTNVISVVVTGSVNPIRARILDSGYNMLASTTFSGVTATFSSPLAVSSGTTYRVIVDRTGASWTTAYKLTETFPVANTELNFTANTYFNGSWTTTTGGSPTGGIIQVYTDQNPGASSPTTLGFFKFFRAFR